MAVALLLNLNDLIAFNASLDTAIASSSGADRTALNRIKSVIGTPASLPLASAQYQQGDGDVRVILLSSQSGTKAQVLDLLDRSWKLGQTIQFLRAIWKDARTSAVDPWVG